ncbi:hypothetical protein [Kribbella sp. VKM Ac-2566]|uniref:hypothetical protein n=1 Tax=Kribbella sp. VKM Ac-2566 TaxID=2512218 RepID=UPI0014170913|nr:hypothetical protein [Kribbella sp. VKM Ac-2566]
MTVGLLALLVLVGLSVVVGLAVLVGLAVVVGLAVLIRGAGWWAVVRLGVGLGWVGLI